MDAHGHTQPGENDTSSRWLSGVDPSDAQHASSRRPQPFTAEAAGHPRWQFWRKPTERDFAEKYRPPRWWQRVFSLVSLAVISLTAGVMVAVAIAAAVAAVAIALQSLVT